MAEPGNKKKVVLAALNAKFIHTSLALRCLAGYCRREGSSTPQMMEFTINQPIPAVMAEIYRLRPDILGFSCYLWNITAILSLCADFKRIAPGTVIILGGPEVSYDAEHVLLNHEAVDIVVRGEGEQTLAELLSVLEHGGDLDTVLGITYRRGSTAISNPDRIPLVDLDQVPFPYQDDIGLMADRIVYFESSRGCPFRCAYCLSAATPGIRYYSLEKAEEDLTHLLKQPVREIKFVDRTANVDESRFRRLLEFIVAHRGPSRVHFEIDASLLSLGMLDFLATVPADLVNFEIGIQSTHAPSLLAVNRSPDWDNLQFKLRQLRKTGNIRLHLDLIAGLPEETWESFAAAFDSVYSLEPHYLQLGFLKLLKGTPLWHKQNQYGYICQVQPPYQVLASSTLTYAELIRLVNVEDLLNRYFNSGDLAQTLRYCVDHVYGGRAMSFYSDLADFWLAQGWLSKGHRKETLYVSLRDFMTRQHPGHCDISAELLKYDYLCRNHTHGLPAGFSSLNPGDINDRIYTVARDEAFIARALPGLAGLSPRDRKKRLHLEYLRLDPGSLDLAREPVAVLFAYDPIRRIASQVLWIEDPFSN